MGNNNTYGTIFFTEIILSKSNLYSGGAFAHLRGHDLSIGLGRRQDWHLLFPRRLRPEADPRLRLDLENIRPARHQLFYDATKFLRAELAGLCKLRSLEHKTFIVFQEDETKVLFRHLMT